MAKHNLADSLSSLALSLPESDILLLIQKATELKEKEQGYNAERRSEAAKRAWKTRKRNKNLKIANGRISSRDDLAVDVFQNKAEAT